MTEEGKPQEVTRYGWDGDRCVYEETAEQKITILYLPGTFSPFARIVQKIYPAPESDDPERDKAVDDAWKMVEKIMGRPLKKPQIPEKELEVQFFIPDHAGTPLFLVDAKGEVLWEALPDDWKATQEVELVKLLVSEYGVRQFIRFQGQWADEETGFYYNRYRFYDPAVGRYISQDPIGLAGGVNLYEYAGNPVDYIDPFGLAQICNRPLKGAPKDIRLWGFGTDLGVYHEHIFYDDGSNQNIGYGQGGTFEERDHEFINDKYRCQLWHPRNEFDDKVMRQAVKEEINTGKWTAEKYNFITHNCQDFVTDVKKRYKAILKNNSQSNGDKPNKGTQK